MKPIIYNIKGKMKNRRLFILYIGIVLILTTICSGCACTPSEPLEDTVYFTDIEAEQVMLGGAPLLIPAYGEIYASGAKVIEIALADTPYLYNGVTTSGEMLGFANNGLGRLTYTDITPNRICLLNTALTCSVDAADVPAVVRCYIYKNGIVDSASLVGDYFVVADTVEALPIVCLIELLDTGDYIELYFESDKDNVTLTVATMTLIATTVD